jgi:glc operon protein GlcG
MPSLRGDSLMRCRLPSRWSPLAVAVAASVAASGSLILCPTVAHAQFFESKVVSLAAAKKIAAAAEAEAVKRNWTVAVAVVDIEGGLILFHRIDEVQAASLDIAIAKARSAARTKRPTRALADAIAKGNLGILAAEGIMPVTGGLPIAVDGKVIGAVGVSGMSSDQDEIIAQAGLDGLSH